MGRWDDGMVRWWDGGMVKRWDGGTGCWDGRTMERKDDGTVGRWGGASNSQPVGRAAKRGRSVTPQGRLRSALRRRRISSTQHRVPRDNGGSTGLIVHIFPSLGFTSAQTSHYLGKYNCLKKERMRSFLKHYSENVPLTGRLGQQ